MRNTRFSALLAVSALACGCGEKRSEETRGTPVAAKTSVEPADAAVSSRLSTDEGFEFECRGLPGVSFRFPVFAGWEPGRVSSSSFGCTSFLRTPPDRPPPIARRMVSAWRVSGAYAAEMWPIAGTGGRFDSLRLEVATKNTNGVRVGKVFDSKAKADPAEPDWSYLQLYDPGFAIRIQIRGGEAGSGFDREAVAKAIAESAELARPAIYELRARAIGAKKLSALNDELSKKIIAALPEGESPEVLFAAKSEKRGSDVVVALWHLSAFADENLGKRGNPGGKSRNALIAPDGTVRFQKWQ